MTRIEWTIFLCSRLLMHRTICSSVELYYICQFAQSSGGGAAGTFIAAELHGGLTWARNLYTKTVLVWPKR